MVINLSKTIPLYLIKHQTFLLLFKIFSDSILQRGLESPLLPCTSFNASCSAFLSSVFTVALLRYLPLNEGCVSINKKSIKLRKSIFKYSHPLAF